MLKLTTALTQNGDVWTLKLRGEPRTSFCDSRWLIDVFQELSEVEIRSLVIDLAGIRAVDSQGLALLLDIQQSFARKQTQVVLRNLSADLRKSLRVMQFDRLFVIDPVQSKA